MRRTKRIIGEAVWISKKVERIICKTVINEKDKKNNIQGC